MDQKTRLSSLAPCLVVSSKQELFGSNFSNVLFKTFLILLNWFLRRKDFHCNAYVVDIKGYFYILTVYTHWLL